MNILKIPNQIIKKKLTPLNINNVDCIALHHMAHKTADVKTIESWHINSGWDAIGYNYFVSFDGSIYEGRGLNVGAGVLKENDHIVSVGFQGDYHSFNNPMPDAQFNAGVDIIKHLLSLLPSCKDIKGHRDFGGSVCPGIYFPFNEMKSLKKRGKFEIYDDGENEMIYDYVDENMPEWARPTIKKLIAKGYLKGDEHGRLGLNDTMLKIFVVNDRAGLYK